MAISHDGKEQVRTAWDESPVSTQNEINEEFKAQILELTRIVSALVEGLQVDQQRELVGEKVVIALTERHLAILRQFEYLLSGARDSML